MRVADEAEVLEALEYAHEFSGICVDVIGEDVFVDWPPRGSVNADESIGAHANGEISQKFPAIGAALHVRIIFKLLSRPETRRLSAAVEIEWLVKYREIVIAHQRRAA